MNSAGQHTGLARSMTRRLHLLLIVALVAGLALADGHFTQAAGTPTISSLDPSTRAAGSGNFLLTVNGTNFENGSVVRWNGADRVTAFVDNTQLLAIIFNTDIACPGTASVMVRNPDTTTSAPAAFTILNNPPLANDDSATTPEDTAVVIAVLANDSGPETCDTPQVTGVGPAQNGTVTFTASDVTYTPNADFSGTDSFSYTITDGFGATATATVVVTVNQANDPPVAQSQTITTSEDTPAAVTLTATDPDGDPLTYTVVSGPSNGTLAGTAPNLTYTPNANYNGSDSFTFTANDGQADSNAATISITVTPVNDAPSAQADSYTTAEDTPLTVAPAGVLANDSDIEGDPLTAVLASGPSNGTLTLNADGSFTYTPNADFNGTDSFTYRAKDNGGATSAATNVSITVTPANDVPTARPDSYTTDEDTPLNIPAAGVLTNDLNPDGGAVTAVPASGPANGTLTLNANGSFSYTPNPDFNGTDSFSYSARDAQGDTSAAAMVTITIRPVNDPPSFTKGADQTVAEDSGPQTVSGWATNISAGPNESGQALSFVVTSDNPTLFAVQPAIDAMTGDLTFTPAPNANGSATVTVTLWDDGGSSGGRGGASTSQTFVITVTPVNDAPVANDDIAGVGQNGATTAIDVLRNDTDVDGDPLSITAVTQGTSGSVAITGGGGGLSYTPGPDFSGTDIFTYTITDGNGGSATATVRITISQYTVYMPLVVQGAPPIAAAPDLVGSFSLSDDTPAAGQPVVITVTITNQGTAPASQFWVDFYIDPTTPPTAANQRWEKSCGAQECPYGIAWYVTQTLAPGQSITLTSTADSYYGPNTRWPGFFVAGTNDLYLYVDSWNPTVATGAVLESDETNNRAERHGLGVQGMQAAPPPQQPLTALPDRPARPTN